MSAPGRAPSPAVASREGSPSATAVPRIKIKNPSVAPSGTASPVPSPNAGNSKRKPSPAPGAGDPPRKKKKGSNTPTPAPEDMEPFQGMITKDEIIDWFRSRPSDRVLMNEVILAFKPKIMSPPTPELKERNQKVFMSLIALVTVKVEAKTLQFKAEYRQK